MYSEEYHPTDVMWNIHQRNTIAEKLQVMFHGFEFRPCIGERTLNADDTLGNYHVRSSVSLEAD